MLNVKFLHIKILGSIKSRNYLSIYNLEVLTSSLENKLIIYHI